MPETKHKTTIARENDSVYSFHLRGQIESQMQALQSTAKIDDSTGFSKLKESYLSIQNGGLRRFNRSKDFDFMIATAFLFSFNLIMCTADCMV